MQRITETIRLYLPLSRPYAPHIAGVLALGVMGWLAGYFQATRAVANPNLAETWSVPIWAPFRAGPERMLFASADVWDGAKKVATTAKADTTVKPWQFIGTVRTGKSYAAVILIGDTGKVQRAAEGDTLPNGEKIVAVGNGVLQIDASGTPQEIKLFDPEKKK